MSRDVSSAQSTQSVWSTSASQLAELLADQGDADRAALARLLQQRLALAQAYVVVVGETSTGKSTLINGLLDEPLLPVDARPTTGIVTHIACRDEPAPKLLAIYRDATQEAISLAQFRQLTLAPPPELLRLQARARPRQPAHIGLHVFDTPGYNAVISQHEEVLRRFLPESDVVVFVVGHRSGFGQSDQDLLEAVAAATAHDPSIPTLLVINRAPTGCGPDDKRVREIVRLAQDGLQRPLELVIVPTTGVPAADGTISQRPIEAAPVWDGVCRQALEPARLAAVQRKLQQQLIDLLDDADGAVERQLLQDQATADQRQSMQAHLELLQTQKTKSLQEIDHTMARLAVTLPKLLASLVQAVHPKVASEVMAANRWLDAAECAQWIASHVLPFEVRAIGVQLEAHIAVELDALNQRLEDLANTALAELNQSARLPVEDPVRRFAMNLASTLGQRLAGNAMQGLLRGVGGVGGAAAGAGNLAKMALSRGGKLFGKTFGREVYRQIGSTFTKKTLERLNVAVAVLVEVVGFVHEAMTWQDKLVTASREALETWQGEVGDELLTQQLPQLKQANDAVISDVYERLDEQAQEVVTTDTAADRSGSLAALRARLAALRQALCGEDKTTPTAANAMNCEGACP